MNLYVMLIYQNFNKVDFKLSSDGTGKFDVLLTTHNILLHQT